MRINWHLREHASWRVVSMLFSYFFRPYINAIFVSSDVLVSHLPKRRKRKTPLSYPKKMRKKLASFHSNRLKTSLKDRTFSFLENVNFVPNIKPWSQKDEKCKQYCISASVDALFFRRSVRVMSLGTRSFSSRENENFLDFVYRLELWMANAKTG